MSDVEPTPLRPPAFVRASAYSPAQVAQLGVPRGLVPFAPRAATPTALHETTATAYPDAAADSPAPPPVDSSLPTAGATHGLGPRTKYRFQAHSAESPVVPPSNLTTDPATSRRAGAVRKVPNVSTLAQSMALAAVALAAVTAGYFFALPTGEEADAAATAPVARTKPRSWSAADLQKLDAVLIAEAARQPREMKHLVDRLVATRPSLGSLRVLEARTAVAQRAFAEADLNLLRAAEEPSADLADISFARARQFGRQRKLDETHTWLTDAIAHDPTRAELYFQRAEVDRRLGRTQDALADFARARALARHGHSPSPETIEFRRRLFLIESGRESEIDAKAYQAAFAQASPPADWMLTAAAIAWQRHDKEAAARWLKASRTALPRSEYVERLDDYVFRNHLDEPGMAGLFPSPAERTNAQALSPPFLIDP